MKFYEDGVFVRKIQRLSLLFIFVLSILNYVKGNYFLVLFNTAIMTVIAWIEISHREMVDKYLQMYKGMCEDCLKLLKKYTTKLKNKR